MPEGAKNDWRVLPLGCTMTLLGGLIGIAALAAAVYFLVLAPGAESNDLRRYRIYGVTERGANHLYTFEFVGEGDSGTIRVLEDETGGGTFEIDGGSIRIDMERKVPDPGTQERQPNVFEGTITPDGSRIEGTWRSADYEGYADGTFVVFDEWAECPSYAELE